MNYTTEELPFLRRASKYRTGFLETLMNTPGTIYGVMNFNRKDYDDLGWFQETLNLFDKKIARLLLGRNWSRKPESERAWWVAVPERATYLHYNSLWRVPVDQQATFFTESPRVWRETVGSGHFYPQAIGDSLADKQAVRSYFVKAFHPRWTIDNTLVSTQFHRKK